MGLLVGSAVGDALGLPAEGMSRRRIQRLWHGEWRHRFLFGRGMVSDDTEHTLFVAQALLTHPDEADAFQRCLAWKFRLWLLGLPAGIGLATLKSILRLWIGFSPQHSGVWSAGNGPAMRSAIIGAYFADAADKRRAFVVASTRLTHTDPRAETAALAIAEAAAWLVNQKEPIQDWPKRMIELSADQEWQKICGLLDEALLSNQSVAAFADKLGLQNGVSGYAYHTVPVALYAWLSHRGDFQKAVEAALNCGGDTDTVGAITGALAGAEAGANEIPQAWLNGIYEWPRSRALLVQVGGKLSRQKLTKQVLGPVRYFWPTVLVRNGIFLIIVLVHGLRRLLPPY